MGLIKFTNIVVDDFNYGKRNPDKPFIYFLTHCHAGFKSFQYSLDHYWGIYDAWKLGPIYCSEGTKALLLVKFPRLQNIVIIEIDH
jgi:hypothetical protein